jgi:hypothetical protein
MAFVHGISGVVFLNGADVRNYFKSFSITRDQDTAETSTFGSGGNKQYMAGMRASTISLDGYAEETTTGINKILYDLLEANGTNYLACMVNTDAVGSVGYATTAGYETSVEEATEIGSAAAITVEVAGSGALDRITSLHAMAAETVSPDVEVQIDETTSSVLGARGHLHVASTDGSLVVKIQHSVDGGGGGTWVDLITFAAATGQTVEVKEYASGGTINRYVRAQWTRTGGTTGTFFVGWRRGIATA